MKIATGTRFDHYEIIAPLGAGGMGEVYLAEDTRLRRKIALKILPETIAQDTDRLRRFEQEAFAASALNHPNILTIYEFGTEGATHFLASEFIDGETLRARLQRAPLSLNETLDIVVQTAQALSAAHEARIIHRDIKPENVMIRKDGIVKVLDFGLAKLTERRGDAETRRHGEDADTLLAVSPRPPVAASLTMPGTVMGTVAYMSPEQARGNPVDARTDLFSLGVMLYEMLTRRQPFTGETINHIIVAILEKEPPPLALDVPAELARILKQTLAKNVDERYPTAQALLVELKKLQMRLLMEAENKHHSSDDEQAEAQTMLLPHRAAAVLEALATAAGSAQPTAPDKPPAKQKWWLVALLSLIVLAAGFFAYRAFAPGKEIESIAILPFTNASGDPEMEYLSDGLTESLINSLAQLPRLRVLPRTTVFRFKGKTDDPQRIGKELGVRAVLTGRVQQRGDSLVIQTELIDVTGAAQLWGERYDRKPADLLATQREVTQAIAGGLRLKLSGAEQQQLAKKGTENNEAYQFYLKGLFWHNKSGPEGFRKGIEYFNQALEKDPNYAPAYAGLARSYINLGLDAISKENFAKGKAAALKAVTLDSNLAEAHTALGRSLLTSDWDYAGAEKEFKRGIELEPDSAIAHRSYAAYLSALGRHQEAIAEAKRALQLDPLTTTTNSIVGQSYLFARQYDQAIEQYRKLLEMDRGFADGYRFLSLAYTGKGQYEEALATAQAGLKVAPDNPGLLAELGYAYARAGQRVAAQKTLDQLLTLAKQREVSGALIALLYAGLGDRDQAFAWLEKAYEARSSNLLYLKVSPRYDSLRADPRFADLVRRVGLPE